MKASLYCNKQKPYLYIEHAWGSALYRTDNSEDFKDILINGKIVAEVDYDIEEIACELLDTGVGCEPIYYTNTIDNIYNKSYLTSYQIRDYLGCKSGGEIVGKAYIIKSLKILNEPIELLNKKYNVENARVIVDDNELALQEVNTISIKECPEHKTIKCDPEELCRILNGQQTIIIRKR